MYMYCCTNKTYDVLIINIDWNILPKETSTVGSLLSLTMSLLTRQRGFVFITLGDNKKYMKFLKKIKTLIK